MKIKNIYIIDPSTEQPVLLEEWRKVEDPTTANKILIVSDEIAPFTLDKNPATEKDVTFDDAVKAAKFFGWSIGTRAQWIAVYEAIHTASLNVALELIGGKAIEWKWYWTEEKDSDQSGASFAWIFNGYGGNVNYGARLGAIAARVFRAFTLGF